MQKLVVLSIFAVLMTVCVASYPGEAVIAFARLQNGKGYSQAQCTAGVRCCRLGPNCWDCSGLAATAWAKAGVKGLPATTSLYASSSAVRVVSHPQIGDIIWQPGHVQLYVSPGQICEAASTRTGTICRAQWYKGSVIYYRPTAVGSQTPSSSQSTVDTPAVDDAPQCTAKSGKCQETSTCGGSVLHGLCPGASDITCCVGGNTLSVDLDALEELEFEL
jgi:cell wall-associated NlpC family hydrolase